MSTWLPLVAGGAIGDAHSAVALRSGAPGAVLGEGVWQFELQEDKLLRWWLWWSPWKDKGRGNHSLNPKSNSVSEAE